jgi:septal ring factor EnvC (AmiA/AmiB activator)
VSEISTEATSEQAEGQAPETDATKDLPDWAVKELEKARKEAANYRTKLREVEPLAEKARELEEAQKTETQRLIERAEAAEAERKRLESHVTRLKVAAKAGIPEELADLLGEGPEETLEARAKALTEWRGNTSAPVPGKPVEATRSTVLAADDNAANPNDWLRKRITERGQ